MERFKLSLEGILFIFDPKTNVLNVRKWLFVAHRTWYQNLCHWDIAGALRVPSYYPLSFSLNSAVGFQTPILPTF